jgi:hypothetical protein
MNEQKLTPPEAIEALERRFELGEKIYEDATWNAHTNREKLDDISWIEERIAHGRAHLAHFAYVMNGEMPDDGDDDGAAIMWLGAMLHEAYKRRKILTK